MPSPGAGRNGRTLIEHAPIAWQDIAGQRVPVSARFSIATNRSVSFALGSYDTTQPLLIDPSLTYSSYLGGTGEIASSLPITTTYYDNSVSGTNNAFLIKIKTIYNGLSSNKYAT
jgi:hypothetical protein